MVTRLDACLSNSCMTFISAPTYLNFPEDNRALTRARDLKFFAQPEQQALFQDLLGLMLP